MYLLRILIELFIWLKALPCGTVSVNTFSEGDIKTPFGGYKQSGSLSRDQGTEALRFISFKLKLFGLVILKIV